MEKCIKDPKCAELLEKNLAHLPVSHQNMTAFWSARGAEVVNEQWSFDENGNCGSGTGMSVVSKSSSSGSSVQNKMSEKRIEKKSTPQSNYEKRKRLREQFEEKLEKKRAEKKELEERLAEQSAKRKANSSAEPMYGTVRFDMKA